MPSVEISIRGMAIGDKFDKLIHTKAGKLERYIHGIRKVSIDLQHNKSARDANDRYKAQITVLGNRFVLRSEERNAEIRSAFDSAIGKMQSRISKYKGKQLNRKGDGSSLTDVDVKEMESKYVEEIIPEIVRRKKFLLLPMDENEALEQMKLIDHEDFFLFFNADTNTMNVLYKRKDGHYGLIEGQID